LSGGNSVTLFYSSAGKVDGVYIGGGQADTAMVARTTSGGNPFAALLDGATNYTIYRDGNPATASDIAAYDVGTYDPVTRILSVSGTKLTGVYENVWPNLESPSKVTVMGVEIPVLPMAADDMGNFKLGQTVTLLLTADRQVAGAVASNVTRGDNIGVVLEGGQSVELLNGIVVSGKTTSDKVEGELVRVNSSGEGKISLSTVGKSSVKGNLNVEKRTIGETGLTGSCRFYEKVGDSAIEEIFYDDITTNTVSRGDIFYTHKTASGKVDMIIFDDVTGDLYNYGILTRGEPQTGGSGSMEYSNSTIVVENAEHPNGSPSMLSAFSFSKDSFGGIAATADGKKAAKVFVLESEKDVKRSDFSVRNDETFVTFGSQEMIVSEDVQCYNAVTGFWFESLADARAFSDDLTVYYDRSVTAGGKIRVVVAN